ncbi:MAG TPA: hypothetical protein VGO93_07715 [Candidatus Xenobia bacterium]|jgi:hypothetical protein
MSTSTPPGQPTGPERPDPDRDTRKADLDAQFEALEADERAFLASLQDVDPYEAAQHALSLAERKERLADEYEAWLKGKHHATPEEA